MRRVKLYVEGGGDSRDLQSRCREGFRKLLESAGFAGHMPRIVACGGRRGAFDRFQTALRSAGEDDYPILLVDSEEPVTQPPWQHLGARDGWVRPDAAAEDQAQLMVPCMETWVMADREALGDAFQDCLQVSALLPEAGLEVRLRDEVQEALEHATRTCGRRRAYRKGERSFEVLAKLHPDRLAKSLSYFARLIRTLAQHLDQPQPT